MYANEDRRSSNNSNNYNYQAAERFSREVCQVPVGNRICGETQTLQITREFRQLYEDKLKQIDNVGGGDCAQVN